MIDNHNDLESNEYGWIYFHNKGNKTNLKNEDIRSYVASCDFQSVPPQNNIINRTGFSTINFFSAVVLSTSSKFYKITDPQLREGVGPNNTPSQHSYNYATNDVDRCILPCVQHCYTTLLSRITVFCKRWHIIVFWWGHHTRICHRKQ